MRGSFTKGMIVGSIIGASMGMFMDNSDMYKKRKKLMRNGRSVIKNSANFVNDISRMFR